MERFEGYVRKGLATARTERLLAADRVLCCARRWVTVLLGAAAPAFLAVVIIRLIGGDLDSRRWLIPTLCCIYLAAVLISLLLLGGLRLFYGGGSPKGEERYRLLCSYVRSLLLDTCSALAPEIRETKQGDDLLSEAREYARGYVLTTREWAVLYSGESLREEGERIRARCEGFLREAIEGEAERYLALRANMRRVINEWRRLHFPSYAEPQKRLLEENLSLLMQQVTDNRAHFLQTRGTRVYLDLLGSATLYRDRAASPKDGEAPALPLPTEEEYIRYLATVESIRHFDTAGMRLALRGKKLEEYRELLDAYRAFRATRCAVGCPEVDIARCEGYVKTAEQDATRCWRCKQKFHARYKRVCSDCRHHVCPRCGSCYCDKHPTHQIGRAHV